MGITELRMMVHIHVHIELIGAEHVHVQCVVFYQNKNIIYSGTPFTDVDTIGAQLSNCTDCRGVLNSGVVVCTELQQLQASVHILKRCPYLRGVHIERFHYKHCIVLYYRVIVYYRVTTVQSLQFTHMYIVQPG